MAQELRNADIIKVFSGFNLKYFSQDDFYSYFHDTFSSSTISVRLAEQTSFYQYQRRKKFLSDSIKRTLDRYQKMCKLKSNDENSIKQQAWLDTPFTVPFVSVSVDKQLDVGMSTVSVSSGPSGSDTVSDGPNGSDSVSDGPSGSDTVSDRPSGSDAVSDGPSGSDAVSDGSSGGDTVSDGRSGGDTVSDGRSGSGGVSDGPSGGDTVSDGPSGGDTVSDGRSGSGGVSDGPSGGDTLSDDPSGSDAVSDGPIVSLSSGQINHLRNADIVNLYTGFNFGSMNCSQDEVSSILIDHFPSSTIALKLTEQMSLTEQRKRKKILRKGVKTTLSSYRKLIKLKKNAVNIVKRKQWMDATFTVQFMSAGYGLVDQLDEDTSTALTSDMPGGPASDMADAFVMVDESDMADASDTPGVLASDMPGVLSSYSPSVATAYMAVSASDWSTVTATIASLRKALAQKCDELKSERAAIKQERAATKRKLEALEESYKRLRVELAVKEDGAKSPVLCLTEELNNIKSQRASYENLQENVFMAEEKEWAENAQYSSFEQEGEDLQSTIENQGFEIETHCILIDH